MQIGYLGDNFHEITNYITRQNKKNNISLSSAEFSQRAMMVKLLYVGSRNEEK